MANKTINKRLAEFVKDFREDLSPATQASLSELAKKDASLCYDYIEQLAYLLYEQAWMAIWLTSLETNKEFPSDWNLDDELSGAFAIVDGATEFLIETEGMDDSDLETYEDFLDYHHSLFCRFKHIIEDTSAALKISSETIYALLYIFDNGKSAEELAIGFLKKNKK